MAVSQLVEKLTFCTRSGILCLVFGVWYKFSLTGLHSKHQTLDEFGIVTNLFIIIA